MKARSVTGRPAEWYVQLYEARREQQDSNIQRMREAQSVLNDDIQIVIHELNEQDKPAVANLAKLGLRQLAQRIASVEPAIYFPSLDLGATRADNAAVNRGKVARGWFADNKMRLRNAQRARHLLAYACAPVTFRPHPKENIPCAYVRHPLNTFPSDQDFFDYVPDNVIFTNTQSFEWLLNYYPAAARILSKPSNWDHDVPNMQHKFTVLEYCDDREITFVAMGEAAEKDPYTLIEYEPQSCILESADNYSGITPAVVPGSINLDKQEGQFDGIFGMYQAQSYLMSMALIATRLAVFRPAWVTGDGSGQEPDVRQPPDPFTGQPGIVVNGQINYQDIDPSMRAIELGAQLEYAARQTAGLPAEFGGMSPTNVRTGRRASQVMSNTIDFTISECQDIFAESLRNELRVQMEIDKAYYGGKKKHYFVSTRNFSGVVDYDPVDLFPKDCPVRVDYPMGGVDLQNLPIEGGQRIQMGTMSRRRFMEIDPAIPDADTEHQQMIVEQLENVLLQTMLAQAADPAQGGMQLTNVVDLIKATYSGDPLHKALAEIQAKAQETQAGPGGVPAEQPGMNPAGMGTEAPPSAPTDDKSMANMAALLSQLGTVQQAQKARASSGSI